MESRNTSEPEYSIRLRDLIEKEVEMGFFDDYLEKKTSNNRYQRDGCRRISYCSCDCDRCTCLIDWMQ